MSDPNTTLLSFSGEKFEPCKVCGEPSSGWHCGAVTCEACKKFFLRSINGEDAKYKCIRNQDCVIVRTTRTQCQYCRFQKCKEVGMTNSENTNNPPVAEIFKSFACSVCKAPSSGIHFGAITCEGCKGFFRRSIKERAPERYRCMENGNCEISAATRNMCRYCRFQKCLKAKMSAQNSRIGRQSNLFKHNIIEWQSRGVQPDYLVTQRKVKRVKSEHSTGSMTEYEMINMNYQTNLNLNSNNTTQQIINVNQYTNQTYIINNINTDSFKFSDATMNMNNMNYNGYYGWPANSHTNYNQATNDLAINGNNQSAIMYNQSIQQTTSSIEDTLGSPMKELIKTIYKIYQLNLNPIVLMKKDFSNKSYNYLNQNYPQSHQLALTYNSNGYQNNSYVDINNFYSNLNEIFDYFRYYLSKVINFLASYIDLHKITQEDKDELIRISIYSVISLSLQRKCEHYNFFNCDQTKFDSFLKIFPILNKSTYFMKALHEKFEKFKLDDKEYALISAILLTSNLSPYIRDYEKIGELKYKFGFTLNQYMTARRNEEITCDEILMILPQFQRLNKDVQEGMFRTYLKIIESSPDAFKSMPEFVKYFLPNPKQIENMKLKTNHS